jgi:hypothetical protein
MNNLHEEDGLETACILHMWNVTRFPNEIWGFLLRFQRLQDKNMVLFWIVKEKKNKRIDNLTQNHTPNKVLSFNKVDVPHSTYDLQGKWLAKDGQEPKPVLHSVMRTWSNNNNNKRLKERKRIIPIHHEDDWRDIQRAQVTVKLW